MNFLTSQQFRVASYEHRNGVLDLQGIGDAASTIRRADRVIGGRRHREGPVWWIDSPLASTATVTGMSSTTNS